MHTTMLAPLIYQLLFLVHQHLALSTSPVSVVNITLTNIYIYKKRNLKFWEEQEAGEERGERVIG